MTMPCTIYYAASRETRFDVPSKLAMLQAANRGEYVAVATVMADNAEWVWSRLQNVERGWKETIGEAEQLHGADDVNHRRSMSVGDIIVWEDERTEVAADFGFKAVPSMIGRRIRDFCRQEDAR